MAVVRGRMGSFCLLSRIYIQCSIRTTRRCFSWSWSASKRKFTSLSACPWTDPSCESVIDDVKCSYIVCTVYRIFFLVGISLNNISNFCYFLVGTHESCECVVGLSGAARKEAKIAKVHCMIYCSMDGGRQTDPNPTLPPSDVETPSAIVVDNSTAWGTYMVTVAGYNC